MHTKIPRRVIAILTAKAFGISTKELDVRTGRSDRQCHARFAICLLVKEFRPETSQRQIADLIGYTDRTSVIHGQREGRRLIVREPIFAKQLRAAQDAIIAWTPGDCALDGSVVFAPGDRVRKIEPSSRVNSVAPSAFAFLASRMRSESVRVPVKEAAE